MQKFNIAKEGYVYVGFFLVLYLISFLLGIVYLSLVALLFMSYMAYFFREPELGLKYNINSIISPAQGKVVRIDNDVKNNIIGKKMSCISIFLSIFDVHVNYVPYDGIVKEVIYKKGLFLNAMNDESSEVNENLSMVLETEKGPIVIKQIAGLIARRVICYAKKGDRLKKGNKYGIIKFGSRVDLYIPQNTKIKVSIGDKVLAGITEIAEFE